MVSEKTLFIINVSLGLLSVLLLLMLIGIELPTLGKAQYYLDKEEPLCLVNWKEEFTPWEDLDRCCLEARKQVECHKEKYGGADWLCESGASVNYWLNNKAYSYCRQQPYW